MIKRVAVVNDLSGLGKCSLTAAIPVLSVMGVQACPLPTAVLTNQTGYDSYYSEDFTDKIDHFTEEWQKRKLTLDGIYTGYLGSAAQVERILHFTEVFRREDTLLFVDPVMGDLGDTFDIYTPEFREQMKRLVLHADVITPNLTEFCLLTDVDYQDMTAQSGSASYLAAIAQSGQPLLDAGIGTIIVTGIIWKSPSDREERYYNLILTRDGFSYVSSSVHGGSYSGTGDLLASVVCAGMVRGESAYDSVRLAADFIEASLIDTVADRVPRNDGINFETHLAMLLPAPEGI